MRELAKVHLDAVVPAYQRARDRLEHGDLAGGKSEAVAALQECIEWAEVSRRYVLLIRRTAEPRSGATARRRNFVREQLTRSNAVLAELREGAAICAAAPSTQNADGAACVGARAQALRRVADLPFVEVPPLDSPDLWTDHVRFRDDATVSLELMPWVGVTRFHANAPETKAGAGLSAALLEEDGSGDETYGARLGFSRLGPGALSAGSSARGGVTSARLDLIQRRTFLLGPRAALTGTLGFGAERVWPERLPPHTNATAAADLVIDVALSPRVHATAGVGYAVATSFDSIESQELGAIVGVTVHFGHYIQPTALPH
jgi:hypothetical protein